MAWPPVAGCCTHLEAVAGVPGVLPAHTPGHRRGDDEIAFVHDRALAVKGGVGAAAFQHKAQGALCVAVRGCDFARQDELDAGIEAGDDAGLFAQAGVFQYQDTVATIPADRRSSR